MGRGSRHKHTQPSQLWVASHAHAEQESELQEYVGSSGRCRHIGGPSRMTLRRGWHEQQWQRWWRSGGGGGGGGSDARVAAIAEQAGLQVQDATLTASPAASVHRCCLPSPSGVALPCPAFAACAGRAGRRRCRQYCLCKCAGRQHTGGDQADSLKIATLLLVFPALLQHCTQCCCDSPPSTRPGHSTTRGRRQLLAPLRCVRRTRGMSWAMASPHVCAASGSGVLLEVANVLN